MHERHRAVNGYARRLVAICLIATSGIAIAQDYPVKPIRLVVATSQNSTRVDGLKFGGGPEPRRCLEAQSRINFEPQCNHVSRLLPKHAR